MRIGRRGAKPVQFKPEWQRNTYSSMAGMLAIPIGLVDALLSVLYFLTGDSDYFWTLIVISGIGALVGATVLFLLPKGWHNCWSLLIWFEDPSPVESSERLWTVALDATEAAGIPWNRAANGPRSKYLQRARHGIEVPSEGVRLWFDNSPPPANPKSTFVRVVFVLEPLGRGRDSVRLKQLIVDSLVREEDRQRQIRRALAGKA